MSAIVRKRINNTIYVYEVKSYRDKNKRVRTKWKILGKEDSDGVLIASKKRKIKNLPAKIIQVRRVSTSFNIKNFTQNHSRTEQEQIINHEHSNNRQKQLYRHKFSEPLTNTRTQNKFSQPSRL